VVLLCFLSVASGNFGKESQGHLKEAQGAGKLCRFHSGLITSIRIFGLCLSFQATPRRLCIAVIFFYWLQMVGHLALTTTRERKDVNGRKCKDNVQTDFMIPFSVSINKPQITTYPKEVFPCTADHALSKWLPAPLENSHVVIVVGSFGFSGKQVRGHEPRRKLKLRWGGWDHFPVATYGS